LKIQRVKKMTKYLLPILMCVAGCAATPTKPVTTTPIVVTPPVVETPPKPFVYDGHVRHFSSWLPNSGADGSAPFTNTMMLTMDCTDPQGSLAQLVSIAKTDVRDIILHSGLMGWGNEGYAVVENLTECWNIEQAFINAYRSRILMVHTADEPPDVAWSYQANGIYNPNLYNEALQTICRTVHSSYFDLNCAVNYGSVPEGLVIPSEIDFVWLETYDNKWKDKLTKLQTLTSKPLALMPPGFVIGNPTTLDSEEASIVQAVWEEAQHNERVTLLVFFLWCCDDTGTGDKNFYTVSGGMLPLTLSALQQVGHYIRGE
jgi:hypothetical protein